MSGYAVQFGGPFGNYLNGNRDGTGQNILKMEKEKQN